MFKGRSRMPRITLQRFFVWLSVLTLVTSLGWTVWKARAAEERLEQLHSQFGVARILDPQIPTARGLFVSDGGKVRIHVYQPAHKRFRICASLTGASYFKQDFPPEEHSFETPVARDLWIHVASNYQNGQGELILTVETQAESQTHTIKLPANHFFNRRARHEIHGSFQVAPRRERYGTGDWDNKDVPLLLFATGEHPDDHRNTSGLVLWLDEAEASTSGGTVP